MKRLAVVTMAICCLSGCKSWFPSSTEPVRTSRTSGEMESGYTYVPIDPFPVVTVPGLGCGYWSVERQDSGEKPAYGPLLNDLPDNAVRMLVEQIDKSGKVTYGTSKIGLKHESYRVTVDYINADTINFPVLIKKYISLKDSVALVLVDPFKSLDEKYEPGSEQWEISSLDPKKGMTDEELKKAGFDQVNIPLYVGIGLRISANVYVVGANASISGLGVLGAEAEAEKLRGSLVVQTLGVNGRSVAAALPIQSELNRTTAQNAIVAVGTIKALLYNDDTVKSPRVVGLYLPFPGGKQFVNGLISQLSKGAIRWYRPCSTQPQPTPTPTPTQPQTHPKSP